MSMKLVLFTFSYLLIDVVLASVQYQWKYSRKTDLYEISFWSDDFNTSDRYIAIAFTRKPVMQNGDAYFCTRDGLGSAAIHMRHEPPTEVPIKENSRIKLRSWSVINNRLQCTFTRPAKIMKQISNGRNYNFDFQKERYFVLTAAGPTTTRGKMHYHDHREAPARATNFASKVDASGSSSSHEERKFSFRSVNRINCGYEKDCFEFQTNCTTDSPDCMLFTYRRKDDSFVMELSGQIGYGKGYMAVAFSTTSKMADADLYYCTGDELRSAVIRKQHEQPVDLSYKDIPGFKVNIVATVNGVGQCVFTRPAKVSKVISNGREHEFDLIKNDYFVLMAMGTMADGKPQYHNIDRVHTEEKFKLYRIHPAESHTASIDTSTCGHTKQCVRSPEGCSTGDPECSFFSWKKENDEYTMELSGSIGFTEYVAVAFAPEPYMQDADLYFCDGQALGIGEIRERHMAPLVDFVTDITGLSLKSASTVDGVGQCTFTRPISVIRQISRGEIKDFNLTSSNYHVLLARGPSFHGEIQFHHKNFYVSKEAKNFENASKTLKRSLLVLLLSFLASVSVVIL